MKPTKSSRKSQKVIKQNKSNGKLKNIGLAKSSGKLKKDIELTKGNGKPLKKNSQTKSNGEKNADRMKGKAKESGSKMNLIQDSVIWDTIIVGAGAAGMTAAITSAKQGQKVLLLERQSQMGRKILVTGNGKCNLTNFAQKEEYYRSDCPERTQKVLSAYGQADTMKLFEHLGIYTKDKNGYVYPYSEQASSVREAFETEILSNPYIRFAPFSEVYTIQKKAELFFVKVREKSEKEDKIKNNCEIQYRCRSLLITTGGLAGPKFGCDGSGYTFAATFGHEIIKPLPALTALKSAAPFLKKVSGVRNQAAITLEVDGVPIKEEVGELQWTDYGISGVAIFQLSRFAITALEEEKKVSLYFDFMPELSSKEKLQQFLKLARNSKKKSLLSFMKGLFPAKLCPVILREAGLKEESFVETLKEKEWDALVMAVGHFALRINGYVGYEKAQVTRGGVSLEELTDSLESVFQPGLFFAGEVADVDGTCGGYNLQWAFSSGTVAGKAIFKRNENISEKITI